MAHDIALAGMLTQHKVQLDLREKNPNMVRQLCSSCHHRATPGAKRTLRSSIADIRWLAEKAHVWLCRRCGRP